jgi:hypothetical protein
MNQFRLKKEYIDGQIITKDRSGNDVLVHKGNFNDHYAKLIMEAGQHHLVEANNEFNPDIHGQKKSFEQVSENVIVLTYDPKKEGLPKQNETPKTQESNSKRGRPSKQKK